MSSLFCAASGDECAAHGRRARGWEDARGDAAFCLSELVQLATLSSRYIYIYIYIYTHTYIYIYTHIIVIVIVILIVIAIVIVIVVVLVIVIVIVSARKDAARPP